jgi:hypothetical protein
VESRNRRKILHPLEPALISISSNPMLLFRPLHGGDARGPELEPQARRVASQYEHERVSAQQTDRCAEGRLVDGSRLR